MFACGNVPINDVSDVEMAKILLEFVVYQKNNQTFLTINQ